MGQPAHRRRDPYWIIGFESAFVGDLVLLSLMILSADPSHLVAKAAPVFTAGLAALGAGSFVFYRISFSRS